MKLAITIPAENKPGKLEVFNIIIKGDFELVTDRIATAKDYHTGCEILNNLQAENQIVVL